MANINVCFIWKGEKIVISSNENEILAKLVFKYINKTKIKDINKFKFIYNGCEISPNSCKFLKELKLSNNSIILVEGEEEDIEYGNL